MGCRISAVLDENGKIVSLEGYTCNVGKKYAQEEFTVPKRMVTALVRVHGQNRPLSVKTAKPIEKSRIFDCLKQLESCTVILPVHAGDVVVPHVCGTDVDIVATREMY